MMNEHENIVDNDENNSDSLADNKKTRRSRASGSNKSSPSKSSKPLVATARRDYRAPTKTHLSFKRGDFLVDLHRLQHKQWKGTHYKTRQEGFFHEDNVIISSDISLDKLVDQEPKETSSSQEVPYSCPKSKVFLQPNENEKRSSIKYCIMGPVFLGVLLWLFRNGYAVYGRGRLSVGELKGTFKSQDPAMWETLQAGLMTSKTEAVRTFLFVHSGNGPTVECLIKQLSDNTCVVRRASDLLLDDNFVSELRTNLEERKCMVIYDLEKLQPDGVILLKGFCDAYTPIVNDSEFFFALDAGRYALGENINKAARDILETTWSKKMPHDDFGGTVTRLTQNVLKISEEHNLPCGIR